MDRYFVDTEEAGQNSIKLRLGKHSAGGRFFSTAEVHEHWKSDDRFCDAFSQALAAVPMDAYFWEAPPLTANTLEVPFECVLTPAPSLVRQAADPRAFAAQFGAADSTSDVIHLEILVATPT